jgi:hypothetical protein
MSLCFLTHSFYENVPGNAKADGQFLPRRLVVGLLLLRRPDHTSLPIPLQLQNAGLRHMIGRRQPLVRRAAHGGAIPEWLAEDIDDNQSIRRRGSGRMGAGLRFQLPNRRSFSIDTALPEAQYPAISLKNNPRKL